MKPELRMDLSVIAVIVLSLSVEARTNKWLLNRQSPLADECVTGDGSSYRGTESRSESGRRCLVWGGYSRIWGPSSGIGNHNYCRNPNGNKTPWCRVQKGAKIYRENCKIPKCSTPTTKPPVVQAEDTELSCGQTSERPLYKVVGGSFAPVEAQPWTAAIFTRRGGFLCGGSLIAPCWVLTAAHCFDDPLEKRFTVYLGKSAINESSSQEQKFQVEKVVTHRRYNASNYNNDIALLKIRTRDGGCAVRSAASRTVCLPPGRTQLPAGYQCSVAGYGKESQYAFSFSKRLKEGRVHLLSSPQCRAPELYGDAVTPNMLCAAAPDWSTDACRGDSGGPLVCAVAGRMFLFGVVSWGEGCAQTNKPGVYTQVTNFNRWIEKVTGLPKFTAGVMYPTK